MPHVLFPLSLSEEAKARALEAEKQAAEAARQAALTAQQEQYEKLLQQAKAEREKLVRQQARYFLFWPFYPSGFRLSRSAQLLSCSPRSLCTSSARLPPQ